MLILTRKIGESILIGDNIRLVVLEIRGRQIRLGIEAPADIVVLREEIAQRLSDENLEPPDSTTRRCSRRSKLLPLGRAHRLALPPPGLNLPPSPSNPKF